MWWTGATFPGGIRFSSGRVMQQTEKYAGMRTSWKANMKSRRCGLQEALKINYTETNKYEADLETEGWF